MQQFAGGGGAPAPVVSIQRVGAKELQNWSKHMMEALDGMGHDSAKAQGLKQPLSSVALLKSNPTHRLYVALLKKDNEDDIGTKIIGILKIGEKHIFYMNETGKMTEIDPVCVLDFYVEESFQRSGYGKRLFDYMLLSERIPSAAQLAYDRPSPKLFPFLRRHYQLEQYVAQFTNFVIFNDFFLQ